MGFLSFSDDNYTFPF